VLLAALSALLYGSADFFGGLASRREYALTVTWYSQGVGLVAILIAALVVPAERVVAADWGWGALGGLSGAVGLLLLYGALARGPMAVVAPVTALLSAIVPVIAGYVQGDRLGVAALVGVVLALPAVVLVASAGSIDRDAVHTRVLVESVVAGIGFGLFFVFFARAGESAGMWPTVSAKAASVTALSGVVLVRRARASAPDDRRAFDRTLRVFAASIPLVAGAGTFDVAANGLFLAASRLGQFTEISVVSAMYPAATVLLASAVLRERVGRAQLLGLALAAAAVGLVAYGRSA